MRKIGIALAVIAAIAALSIQYLFFAPEIQAPPEPCDSDTVQQSDHSVYRALLEDNFSQPRTADGATIFVPTTIQVSDNYLSDFDYRFEYISMNHPRFREEVPLSQKAVKNFVRLSDHTSDLGDENFKDLPIVLTNNAEIKDVFQNKGGWRALGASTIVRFSRIGFSCDRKQALLYRTQVCGNLCGHGDFVVLELDGEDWRVVSSKLTWIS